MNDKISSELFSSIISNINQIPNNSTPIKVKGNSKHNQKLLQIYQIYNIDSSSQSIFTKLFSYINDYYLRNNLIKIMSNIGTKYYSFSTSNINTSFTKCANDELLNLFAEIWNYFNKKSENLKNLEFEENQYASDEFIEYEKALKETICFTCGLINIVIFMFKKQFAVLDNYSKKMNLIKSKENINKINGQFSKENIQQELNMLFIINKNKIWLEPLITLLEQILKFFLNSNFYKIINMKLEKYRKKEKDGLITTEEIIQHINYYINYLIDDDGILKKLFNLVIKYSALNTQNALLDSIIQINDLNSLLQRFFNIYFIFLMNQKNSSFNSTEEQMYSLGINILECLLNSKFKDRNYGVDFVGYFFSTEYYLEETFDEINIKIINGINELNASLSSNYANIKLPNLNLLQKYENVMKDYILYIMVSSNNKDSLCDCFYHYLPQRKIFVNFGLLRAYLLICKSIRKSLILDNKIYFGNDMNEKKKEIMIGNIFDDLMNELRKYNIILPVKMFLFKSYFIHSIFVVLYKFVKHFHRYILTANNDKLIFYNNISIIKEMSESVNYSFFLLGNDILNYLKFPTDFKNKNAELQLLYPCLRIIDELNPLEYKNISQEKMINPNTKKIHSQKIKYSLPSFNCSVLNKINSISNKKENINCFGNSSIFNSNKKPKTTNFKEFFNNNMTNKLDEEDSEDSEDSSDNNDNDKNNNNNIHNNIKTSRFSLLSSNIFKSNIIQSEVKKRRSTISNEFIYRYDISELNDIFKKELVLPLIKIGFDYKIENNKQYLYIIQEADINPDISQIIRIDNNKMSRLSLSNMNMYNIIKYDCLSNKLIEHLFSNYIDGIDESNVGKNIEISLKYYDTNVTMDYFTFVEKCKKLIL